MGYKIYAYQPSLYAVLECKAGITFTLPNAFTVLKITLVLSFNNDFTNMEKSTSGVICFNIYLFFIPASELNAFYKMALDSDLHSCT